MEIIQIAIEKGAKALSEHDSKRFLAEHGMLTTVEQVVSQVDDAVAVSADIGYPVVLKGSGETLSHKSELGLIAVDLRTEAEVRQAYERLMSCRQAPVNEILVQQMIKGDRELVMGFNRDAQFGPCVMFGLGGIFTEILKDVSFRIAPLTRMDAMGMLDEIKGKNVLGPVRGKPAVDRDALADMLMTLGQIGLEYEQISEIDINPVKFQMNQPVAVDALVILGNSES
ncbi:MAG: acetate--CoA ligase family protein [Deltaproteobacteria bacterium]|nr:acetate--CoA ligase family protein [Deltaproteobacteria bacterium]